MVTETLSSASGRDVRRIFRAVRGLSGVDRSRYLDDACGPVGALRTAIERLLRHHDAPAGFVASVMPPPADCRSVSTWAAGTRIGSYTVVRTVGEGATSTVLEAEQDVPARRVALKLLRPALRSVSAAGRLAHEADVLGRFHDAGIALVYEAGVAELEYGGQPYIAMQLIDGIEINQAAGNRNVRERLELFLSLCDTVITIHRKRVVHGDLKPSNILVDRGGQPVILDFGVARIIDDDEPAARLKPLMGTLAYMSPEQADERAPAVDVRNDVYALGVILFELLTGMVPIDVRGMTVRKALTAIRTQPPRALDADDGRLDAIVRGALAKRRERRYPSVAELAGDVRRNVKAFARSAPNH